MKRTLLLIGGGHSHVEVLRRFAVQPENGVDIRLISPTAHTPYSGMLPGLIAGHYDFHQCHIDLPALARRASCEFVQSEVNGIDTASKSVSCADGSTIGYDVASIDIGSTPATHGIGGVLEHALRVKPTDRFLAGWEQLLQRAGKHDLPKGFRVVVAGGGAAGVEVLLAMQHRLIAMGCHDIDYAIVTDSPGILQEHSARVRAAFSEVLQRRGVAVHCNRRITEVTADSVVTATGEPVPADLVIWATGASAAPWPADSGLAVNERGFIRIGQTLQVIGQSAIFAAGDIASMEDFPRPKSGVYAVRQGPPLTANLRRAIDGRPLLAYRPQKQALALISTGDRYAVASRGWLFARGRWVWGWKDHIDRSFMQRYQ